VTPEGPSCQLARFSRIPCNGRLIRAHLIPKQVIHREAPEADIWDPRVYVLACGGGSGIGGHHGMLDFSRTIRIPRRLLPPGLEEFANQYGLAWYLDRHYGLVES
jgi:hypothetical protein